MIYIYTYIVITIIIVVAIIIYINIRIVSNIIPSFVDIDVFRNEIKWKISLVQQANDDAILTMGFCPVFWLNMIWKW